MAHKSLTSASHWKKAHLDCLNAEYDRHFVSDLSFGDIVIPADLQQRMTHCGQAKVDIDIIAKALENSNDSKGWVSEITVDFEFDSSLHPAISVFGPAFGNLLCYRVVVITQTKKTLIHLEMPVWYDSVLLGISPALPIGGVKGRQILGH